MSEKLKSSSVYTELHSLPVMKSVGGAYEKLKDSSRLASAGLTVLEYSCTLLLGSFYDSSSVAKGVDAMAGKGVAKLIDKYPALSVSPKQIQDSTTSVLKRTVRRAMKTSPGEALLKGLDWTIDKAEHLLRKIKPKGPKSPRKKKLTRSALQKQGEGKGKHAYALDDSGACDSDTRLARPAHACIPEAVDRLADTDRGLLRKVFTLTCVLPLEATVTLLKATRRFAGGKRKKKTSHEEHSPGGRRKVSPKKKVTLSLFGKLKNHAIGLLGYPGIGKRISVDILNVKAVSSDKVDEDDELSADKKRKYDEIVTDPDSDSSDDMANFDFETYDSEDDPDYQPSESDSSASEDLSECDTESEVETESFEPSPGLVLMQLKENQKAGKEKKDLNDNKKLTDAEGTSKKGLEQQPPTNKNKSKKNEAQKTDPLKTEPHKTEPNKTEQHKTEQHTTDPHKTEPHKSLPGDEISLRPNSKYSPDHASPV